MKKSQVRTTLQDYQAEQAVPKQTAVGTEVGKSAKPVRKVPTFEQQLEDEINSRLKKGKKK